MFNPSIYENSQPDGFALLEVVAPARPDDRPTDHLRSFVPLQRTELRGTVMGPLANLCLTQIFRYDRTAYDGVIEARYRFPLPGDAAVTAVTVRFGDVEIAATLQERAAAEASYAEAKAAGRQAALATRETPDLFTLQIAGLQPDEPIVVATSYVQLAHSAMTVAGTDAQPVPEWSLRIPLTTAPRYVRSDERGSRAAEGQPLALLRDPGHRFVLDLEFQGVAHVGSPTHELVMAASTGTASTGTASTGTASTGAASTGAASTGAASTGSADVACLSPAEPVEAAWVRPGCEAIRIQLAADEVLPDRDCLLRWSPPQSITEASLGLLTHYDKARHRLYFLAMVAPPLQRPITAPAREVTLLVDHSGSMSGPKWAAADWAVERFLRDLLPTDAFALAMFHYQTRWFAPSIQPAAPTTVDRAVQWLQAEQDSGGTELGVALEQALHLPHAVASANGEVARHLLIVTDAAVSDAARILRLADDEARRADRRRISVLCIDAAPNAFLANELAERGGGVARFLTSDPAQNDIVTALDEVLLEWRQPLLVNLQLTVNRPDVAVSGRRHGTTTSDGDQRTFIDLGDLAAGRVQWVVGCFSLDPAQAQDNRVTFDLFAGAQQQRLATRTLVVDDLLTTAPDRSTAALKALFGARRINALEYLMNAGLNGDQLADQLAHLGYDAAVVLQPQEDAPPMVYAENRRWQTSALVRPLLVQEALDYGLVSAETAFVATRKEAGQPVITTVNVANALPAGWSGDFLAATGTAAATGARMRAYAPAMPISAPAPTYASTTTRTFSQKLSQIIPSFMPQLQVSAGAALQASAVAGRAATIEPQRYELFRGVPSANVVTPPENSDGIVLFDSAATDDPLPTVVTFTGLMLRPYDEAGTDTLHRLAATHELTLAIYIGDLIAPRATIRLRDLLRTAIRPINLRRDEGATVCVTLHDPTNLLQENNVAFTLVLLAA